MHFGSTIFSQLMEHLPWYYFRACVQRYQGDHKVKTFKCADHFRVMAFAQLTYRESLRDIEVCLRAVRSKLYHMGIHSAISRDNLSHANEQRDWRIYADFAQILIHEARRLYEINLSKAFFVTRAKNNFQFKHRYSHRVDRTTGLLCDQTVALTTFYPAKAYPEPLRRIKFHDAQTDHLLVFLTNDFTLPALTIAQLFKARWKIELFFKWIKQHLRIKAFYGTSPNAVKTQVWIAICTYLLVAIVKKRLRTELSLYTILQVLSVSLLEKVPMVQTLTESHPQSVNLNSHNQLLLFK
ncbi:MAG: IS4 family transposase [Planctomycetota bacterium]